MNFIHPKSEVDPRARLGDQVYVAAFACIRADEGEIRVGNNTSIQESCVVHGKNVSIGDNVTVGHGAIVHGCKVADNVLIGMNATLLNGSEIGEWSIVAAGAVVTEGTKVPSKSIVAGVPGKVLRACTDADLQRIKDSAQAYVDRIKQIGQERR